MEPQTVIIGFTYRQEHSEDPTLIGVFKNEYAFEYALFDILRNRWTEYINCCHAVTKEMAEDEYIYTVRGDLIDFGRAVDPGDSEIIYLKMTVNVVPSK